MDIVQAVKEGQGYFEWAELRSTHGDITLILQVMRDAMKFDDVPPMTWNRKVKKGSTARLDGVRLPATGAELQTIADLLNCMQFTPKVLDLMWLESDKTGVQFDAVVNSGPPKYTIFAEMDIYAVHKAIENALEAAGGDNGGIIMSVGKYWVLVNALLNYAANWACNYSWASSAAPAHRISVLKTHKVWQQEGFGHGDNHLDPSQVIRLMYRYGLLIRPGEAPCEVDLHVVAGDPELAPLISHEGVLKVLRQRAVEPTPALQEGLNLPSPSLIV
jgi:hypothetical protein